MGPRAKSMSGDIGRTHKRTIPIAAILKATSACLLILILAACGDGSNLRSASPDMTGSGVMATVHSAQTDFVYPIYIYLPASYDSGTTSYPVIYATDADAPFPPNNRFVNFTRILQRQGVDAILVGIGGTVRRDTDYVLPGAIAYHEFLTRELIPYIESHFRADPRRRILSGISLGGSFVVTALFLEAPKTLFFSHYISAEGAFHQPSFIAQERQLSATIGDKSIPATLILARGGASTAQERFSGDVGAKNIPAAASLARGLSDLTNIRVVDAFYHRMTDRHYTDLILIETHFPTDHVGTDNPSFEDAVARIFK